MPLEVNATYENGVLRPDGPLPLDEHVRLRISITLRTASIRESAGLVPFHGGKEALNYLLGPDNQPWER